VNSNFSKEFDKVFNMMDEQRSQIMEEIVKRKNEQFEELSSMKSEIEKLEDQVKASRFITDEHTQYIREYELKQGIFQTRQLELMNEELVKMNESIKKSLHEFDVKLMK